MEHRATAVASAALRRALRGDPFQVSDLQQAVDDAPSRQTIYRVLGQLEADDWIESEGGTWYPSFKTFALTDTEMTERDGGGFSVTADDVFDVDAVGPIVATADAAAAGITRAYDAVAGRVVARTGQLPSELGRPTRARHAAVSAALVGVVAALAVVTGIAGDVVTAPAQGLPAGAGFGVVLAGLVAARGGVGDVAPAVDA